MQEALIRHVYAKAELSLADTRYFEAHGTGTPTGDPIELTAISKAFRSYRSTEHPLYVGSVKANLGHLEGSSGLAGVIKAILILEKGVIPPNALFENMVLSPNDENGSVLQVEKLQNNERIDSPDLSQPLCTVLQIALTDLLSSLGVKPVAVVGHSSGEIAAGYAAGALSHHSACKVAYFRGKLAAKLRETTSSGTMLSVALSSQDVAVHIESSGMQKENNIHVACVNSPMNVTLSGTVDDIESFRAYLDEQEIFSRTINTGVAYHSPAMQAIAEEYAALLDPLEAGIPTAEGYANQIFSSVTGAIIEKKVMIDPRYWVKNLVSTVQFAGALSSLVNASGTSCGPLHSTVTDLIEIGPHGALRRPVKDTLSSVSSSSKTSSAIRYHSMLERSKSSLVATLELVGSLFCLGFSVSVLAANRQAAQAKPGFLVDCPSYPFDHSRRYWSESRISKDFRLRPHSTGYLLGKRSNDHNTLRPRWRNWLSTERLPWLADHAVSDDTVCPGSGMLVMALEAVRQAVSGASRPIAGFRIREAQFLAPIKVGGSLEDAVETEVHLRATQKAFEKESSRFDVTIFTHRDERWTQCFHADMQVEYEYHSVDGDRTSAIGGKLERDIDHERIRELVTSARDSCTRPIDTGLFYKFCADRGVRFGSAFQLLKDIHWDGSDISVATLNVPPRSSVTKLQSGESPVHPTALDAAVHLIFTQFTKGINPSVQSATLIPQQLTNGWISAKAWDQSPTRSSLVRLSSFMHRQSGRAMSVDGAFYALSEDQSVLCAMENMTLTEVSRPSRGVDHVFDPGLLYSIAWKPLLSSLGPDQLQKIFEAKPDKSSTEMARQYHSKIELGMLMAGFWAVHEVPGVILEKAPKHLRNLAGLVQRLFERHQSQGGSCPSAAQVEDTLDQCDADVPELHLFSKVARSLPLILRSELNPLDVLFGSEAAKRFYSRMFEENTKDGRLERFLDLKSHEIPNLKIIEVGAGTGGFTEHIFGALERLEKTSGASRYGEYTYSDISASYFEGARGTFSRQLGRMKFATFDVEKDPSRLGGVWDGALGTFDLVVAGSVLHATSSLERTLKNLRKLLKPGGHLILFEITAAESTSINIAFGSLEGWWLSEEDWRRHGPLVNEERWETVLRSTGFSGLDLTLKDHESDDCHLSSIMVSTAVGDAAIGADGTTATTSTDDTQSAAIVLKGPSIRVLLDTDCELQQSFAARIKEQHPESEFHPWKSNDSIHNAMGTLKPNVVISLLDVGGQLLAGISESEFQLLQQHVQDAQQLLWVSSKPDTNTTSTNDQEKAIMGPYHAACMGFLRAIRSEDVGKHIVTLTIESCAVDKGPDFALSILQSCFLTTGLNNSYSEEVEFRVCNDKLSVGRMIHEVELDARREDHITPQLRHAEWQSSPPLVLDVGAPGMLDSLRFIRDEEADEALGEDEVEIEAAAWGLSFRDILIGLGRLGTERLGFECGGVVRRVGSRVANSVRPGDRVVMLMFGCIKKYPRAPALTTLKLADNVSFEEAVSIMAPAVTAYHSLVNVARLTPGEKILVHAGAGATGQLFIRVAQMLGAEVFATVGSAEKKDLLVKDFKIPEDRILYSRDAMFAQAVKRLTLGRGVDVVVNSLSGNLLEASWSCLGPNGRFIEIGKADIRANSGLPMNGFSRNRSFAGVDVHDILLNDGHLMRQLMQTVMELAEKGNICCPTPIQQYLISQIEPAFRYIQSGKNVGRVVLTVQPGQVIPAYLVAEGPWRFDDKSSYLVVGGFGGLGRAIISWMVRRGARNIISMSRSGASSEAAVKLVADLAQKGVRLAAKRCDVSSHAEVSTALAQCADMPPIKGCINSAMSLQDAFFENMTHAQWKTTIQSKIATSWNLHCLLPTDMDFFILLSSLAGIYGSVGQSNYAAGCTFQDALAEYRSSLGLSSSISLDLGWMRTIGIVAEKEEYQRVRQRTRDMQPVEEADFLALLDDYCDPARGVLQPQESQLLVGAITPAHFRAQGEAPMPFMNRPMFAGLDGLSTTLQLEVLGSKHADTVELFQQAENDEQRLEVVLEALKGRLARALGVSTDDIDKREALSDYGVDSLMAVELRNWVRKDFGASVSVFEIMGGKSISDVGRLLVLRAHEGA
ncbi:putative PKS/NRPS-like protein biosynthetic cluster [Gnomoniopsis sp. IMI 355080]|nr:putative PKS/NRPS-like protein biosynthetic cluster [Gnomoniopsis sp. IMI 355080]